jgi:hypothetical protein
VKTRTATNALLCRYFTHSFTFLLTHCRYRVTRLRAGRSGFDFRRGLGIFIFTIVSRLALGSTQPPIRMAARGEADHSPPSSSDFKNTRSYTFTLPHAFMAWCLFKHRDKFTFTLNIQNHDSLFSIALGYGLDGRGSRFRFRAGAKNFSLHHRVQNGSEAHPASYPMGTRGSFLGGKAAGA